MYAHTTVYTCVRTRAARCYVIIGLGTGSMMRVANSGTAEIKLGFHRVKLAFPGPRKKFIFNAPGRIVIAFRCAHARQHTPTSRDPEPLPNRRLPIVTRVSTALLSRALMAASRRLNGVLIREIIHAVPARIAANTGGREETASATRDARGAGAALSSAADWITNVLSRLIFRASRRRSPRARDET